MAETREAYEYDSAAPVVAASEDQHKMTTTEDSKIVSSLRKFPPFGTLFAMMLDGNIPWYYRIPVINFAMLCFWGDSQSFEQIIAQQEFYGLVFTLLLMVPLGFLGAVDYEELEDAQERIEDGNALGCLWLPHPSQVLGFNLILGSFFLLSGLVSVLFVDVLVKTFKDEAETIYGPKNTEKLKECAKMVQRWVRVVSTVELVLMIYGIVLIVNSIVDIVIIKFPDSLALDRCEEDYNERGSMPYIATSPIGFVQGRDWIISHAVVWLLVFSTAITYEFQKKFCLNMKEEPEW